MKNNSKITLSKITGRSLCAWTLTVLFTWCAYVLGDGDWVLAWLFGVLSGWTLVSGFLEMDFYEVPARRVR